MSNQLPLRVALMIANGLDWDSRAYAQGQLTYKQVLDAREDYLKILIEIGEIDKWQITAAREFFDREFELQYRSALA